MNDIHKTQEQSEFKDSNESHDGLDPELEDKSAELPDSEEPDTGACQADEFSTDTREELVDKLVSSSLEIKELKDGFVRSRADVENIQRRSHNEIVTARKFAIEGFARELLTVLDSLDQASRVELEESNSVAVEKMREGLELTLKQLEKVMEKFGVAGVEAQPGTKFDPEIHQAISMIEGGEIESGCVVSVMQKGFTLKDRLLRPAMVAIAS
jgi:molecular chaperone GrpE